MIFSLLRYKAFIYDCRQNIGYNAVMCKILKTTLKSANFTSIPINIIGISVSRIQTVLDFSLSFSKAVPSGTENKKYLMHCSWKFM